MANVKITVNGPLMDGHKVTFKAPCNCDVVEKLDVRYVEDSTQKSKLFTMKDTHGNDVTGLGNLFEAESYVHVILDTVNCFAYLQNADTNGYIEKRLGGFTFYNNPSLVYNQGTKVFYKNADDEYVLADSETAKNLMKTSNAYVASNAEGNFFSVGGADTVSPFKGGGVTALSIPSYTVTTGGSELTIGTSSYSNLSFYGTAVTNASVLVKGYKADGSVGASKTLVSSATSKITLNIMGCEKVTFKITADGACNVVLNNISFTP